MLNDLNAPALLDSDGFWNNIIVNLLLRATYKNRSIQLTMSIRWTAESMITCRETRPINDLKLCNKTCKYILYTAITSILRIRQCWNVRISDLVAHFECDNFYFCCKREISTCFSSTFGWVNVVWKLGHVSENVRKVLAVPSNGRFGSCPAFCTWLWWRQKKKWEETGESFCFVFFISFFRRTVSNLSNQGGFLYKRRRTFVQSKRTGCSPWLFNLFGVLSFEPAIELRKIFKRLAQ